LVLNRLTALAAQVFSNCPMSDRGGAGCPWADTCTTCGLCRGASCLGRGSVGAVISSCCWASSVAAMWQPERTALPAIRVVGVWNWLAGREAGGRVGYVTRKRHGPTLASIAFGGILREKGGRFKCCNARHLPYLTLALLFCCYIP
jgi:hypothetical protein